MHRYRLFLQVARTPFLFPRTLCTSTGIRRSQRRRLQEEKDLSRGLDEEEELVFLELAPSPAETEETAAYERRLQLEYQQLQEAADERRREATGDSTGPQAYIRGLRLQAKELQSFLREADENWSTGSDRLTVQAEDSQFTDVDIPPESIKVKPIKTKKKKGEHKIFGSPDPLAPVSGEQCSGCGAIMHCIDPAVPGYLPSEKYTRIVQQSESGERPEKAICQRCFLLVYHQKALDVSVPREEYRRIVSSIREENALVLFMVDMLDLPNSVISDLTEIIGENKHILVLGNKIDLLPGDSPGYLKRLKGQLFEYCKQAGINIKGNMTNVHLISAKTGYGVEELISKLQTSWKYMGNVYLVGTTNAGKSTLFNTLLQSDYCRSKASDIIKRATISPWPGTTLNLLKFPIVNPTPYRIFRRMERLKADAIQSEEDLGDEEQKHLGRLKKQGYLIGRVGRTFTFRKNNLDEDIIDFDADALSFSMDEDAKPVPFLKETTQNLEFTPTELKNARWFYDTPGIVKENCVLNLLKDKEVKVVLPSRAIVPRTFILQPRMTLFLGALGRIDFLQGEKSAWFSVVASNHLPVHVTHLEKADAIYQTHAGKALLGVPMGGEERMKEFPPLVPEEITLTGIGTQEAVADIKLSSSGWVAITAHSDDCLHLRVYTPEGTTITVRQPPLLPHIVHIKGERVRKSQAYATKKPSPLVSNLRHSPHRQLAKK
ncbi:nitric oxide-associated protein 1 [Ambystoma mexicanum]|uniref:nitric oxide-associated protein 1 n=1 Tax=Ambystoma mexicanum TaxID=8296 RepID=UPI0037E7354D